MKDLACSVTSLSHIKRKSLPTIYESVSPVKKTRNLDQVGSMTVARNTARDFA